MANVTHHGSDFSEQVRRVETRVRPAEMTNMTATGDTDEWGYSGTITECQDMAGQVLATAGPTRQVRTTLTRTEGNNAELSVVVAYYRPTAQDASQSPGGGSASGSGSGSALPALPTAGSWGTSKENPAYEFAATTVQEPIITHPKITQYPGTIDPVSSHCLAYIASGGGPHDPQTLPNQVQSTAYDWLTQHGYSELLDLVSRSPYYLDAQGTLTVTWQVAPDSPSESFPAVGTIQEPEGPIKVKAPRNWLYTGGTYRSEGKVTSCVKTYRLSGPNGWDPTIYSEQ